MAVGDARTTKDKVCVYYLKGVCKFADHCLLPHTRPACAFGRGCNRRDCVFLHPLGRDLDGEEVPSNAELASRKRRCLRFGASAGADVDMRIATSEVHPSDCKSQKADMATARPLAGTSQSIERCYMRFAGAMPVAEQVRPLPLLQQTLERIRLREETAALGPTAEWAAEAEQLRSIRLDITIQHLQDSAFACELYILNAEFALRHDDTAQFIQSYTQLSLLLCHAGAPKEHLKEVNVPVEIGSLWAARLLLAHIQGLGDQRDRSDALTNEMLTQRSGCEQPFCRNSKTSQDMALSVHHALSAGNFHRALRVVLNFTEQEKMSSGLRRFLQWFLSQMRLALVGRLCQSHRGALSLRVLGRQLCFTGEDHADKQSKDWLIDNLGVRALSQCKGSISVATSLDCRECGTAAQARLRELSRQWRQQRTEHAQEFVRS